MATIIVMTGAHLRGPLYHSPRNQLRRAVGRHTDVYVGDRAGTVLDRQGRSWDWWETDEPADGTFRKIRVVPAS